ncbi:MAG: hypothetical protein UR93_C0017G0003 [Berkelbacteria bacterium GW2011_GWA2_35_9]|uniref:NYN domain-containing protein n=1 Tax=Berkelbacteria bacterium GW2011_GWA2_35_9 TaxID=1618333 RepID=A0A0G0D4R5_9BACT|nr:MAG: hypothetical protein UR93_C0017G0003 [Berkelbacteria bacterium GW2011_GWA2_35_9]
MAIRVDHLKFINLIINGRRVIAKTIFCKLPHSNSIRGFHRKLKRKCHLKVICGQHINQDIDYLLREEIEYFSNRDDVDTIILVAGDGGYLEIIDHTHKIHQKKIEIIAIKEVLNHDYFGNGFKLIDLRELRPFIIEDILPRKKRIGPTGSKRNKKAKSSSIRNPRARPRRKSRR